MLADVASRVLSPVLVGRSGQLSVLDTALAEAASGRPSAVVVGGEAGVGKSRLVDEFAGRSRGAGVRVLTGGCLELGADSLPFAPFTAVLRGLVRDLGTDGIAELLPDGATRELARLMPEFGEPAGLQDTGEARARLFEQMLIASPAMACTASRSPASPLAPPAGVLVRLWPGCETSPPCCVIWTSMSSTMHVSRWPTALATTVASLCQTPSTRSQPPPGTPGWPA